VTLQASIEELRTTFKPLSDLSDCQLQWLLDRSEYRTYAPGEYMSHTGDPADFMLLTLEGTFHAKPDNAETPALIITAGMISGFLPFSRMTKFPLSTRAHTPLRVLALHKQHFPALYQELPELIPKLVGILTDRVRETTRATTQTEKLAAIGKLAAGLAHELNNPAAAARQASGSAKQIFDCYRETLDLLAALCSSKEIYAEVRALEAHASAAVHTPQPIDSLTRSDLEESILTWLESIGIEDPWRGAPAFVNAGFTVETLSAATCHWPPEIRELALYRVAAAIEMEQVLAQMHHSTTRMSDLVTAMKDYSFMDRAAAVEIDVNQSLQSTLTLFSFRFKSTIQLITNYAPNLPKLHGHGGQLNQVWTNLIDNALDAMEMQKDRTTPGELRITTTLDFDNILIEISDNGPGIPADVAAKVFDPFFTTKPQGEGTGLGLDTVYRVIRQHEGSITFKSEPTGTTFSVRLPLKMQP
jgi:signal transduction histidine kinase